MSTDSAVANRRPAELDGWRVIVAACALSAIGALLYNVLPLFVGALDDSRAVTAARIGLVTAVYYLSYSTVTSTGFLWIRRVDWRLISLLCLPSAVAGLLMIVIWPGFLSLVAGVALAGAAMGTLYGICTTVLGDTTRTGRNFGFKIGAEVATGIVLLLALPGLVIEPFGFDGLVLALAGCVVLLGATVGWMPRGGAKESDASLALGDESTRGPMDRLTPAVGLSLLALLCYFSGMSSLWAFLERIGRAAGISNVMIGQILSVSLVAALGGAFLAATLGDRIDRRNGILVATAICLAATLTLTMPFTSVVYLLVACAFNAAFPFVVAMSITSVAQLDPSGRFVVLTAPVLGMGAALGPAVAGSLIDGSSYLPVIAFSAGALGMSAVLVTLALRRASSVATIVPVANSEAKH
jgi:predicted MFS family arabinose efflux permease